MQWENVHIFISSTFNDMHAERDYLVKSVFPALAEWCEERKLRLIDIDLRWGVTSADSEAKNTVRACLRNIDECRPFFLCFLGQRRGWVPSVDDIGKDTYELFPNLLHKHYVGETSVTEMEILHALVDPLHNGILRNTKDDSRSGKAVEYAFFYLREPKYLEQLPHQDLYAIYTNDAEYDPATADKELIRWKDKEIPQTGRPVYSYTTDWQSSENTPEIALPIFVPTTAPIYSDAWKNAFAGWKKRWALAGVSVNENGEITGTELGKAKAYNTALTKGRLGNYQVNNRPLADVIIEQLKVAISARFPAHMTIEEQTPLQKEIDQQAQFLRITSEGFIERAGDFDALSEYIQSNENRPFAVTAYAGMGKTSLLAHFIDTYQSREGESLHYRFIGGSDDSVNAERLVRSLLSELKQAGKLNSDVPADSVDMMNKLFKLLTEAGTKGKTIIVIDALNQLETGMSDLHWIPATLPESVKLIVSFKRGEDSADEFYRYQDESGSMILHSVKPFDSLADRKALVSAYLEQYFKELDEPRIQAMIESDGAENPLFLKVALSELRVFGVHNDLSEAIRTRFGNTPVKAFHAILERMESDPAYTELTPAVALPHVFGWIAHSRHGISVDELADLLVRENLTDSKASAFDSIYLILRQLRPFLAKRDGRMDFFYESFKMAAIERYASGHQYARRSIDWHNSLAQYFETLPFDNRHRLMEQVWQYIHAGMSTQYENLMFSFEYNENRLTKFSPNALIEDCGYSSSSSICLLSDFYNLAYPVLYSHPDQLATQLWARMAGLGDQNCDDLLQQVMKDKKRQDKIWLRPLMPCMDIPGGNTESAIKDTGSDLGFCFALSPDEKTVITEYRPNGLAIWDLSKKNIIRKIPLRGNGGVESIRYAPDGNSFAIRRNAEIHVWDTKNYSVVCTINNLEDYSRNIEKQSWVVYGGFEYTNDSKGILVQTKEGLSIFDTCSGVALSTVRGNPVAYSYCVGNSGLIAVGSWDLSKWTIEVGAEIKRLILRFAKKKPQLVMDSGYQIFLFDYDIRSGALSARGALKGHELPVHVVSVSENGNYIASTSADGNLRLWNADSYALLRETDIGRQISALRFFDQEKKLFVTCYDGYIRIFSVPDMTCEKEIACGFGGVADAVICKNELQCIVLSDDRQTIKVVSLDSVANKMSCGSPINNVGIDRRNNRIVASSFWNYIGSGMVPIPSQEKHGKLHFFDASNNRHLFTTPLQNAMTQDFVYVSPNGQSVVSRDGLHEGISFGANIKHWSLDNSISQSSATISEAHFNVPDFVTKSYGAIMNYIRFSSDHTFVIICKQEKGTISVYRVSTGELLCEFESGYLEDDEYNNFSYEYEVSASGDLLFFINYFTGCLAIYDVLRGELVDHFIIEGFLPNEWGHDDFQNNGLIHLPEQEKLLFYDERFIALIDIQEKKATFILERGKNKPCQYDDYSDSNCFVSTNVIGNLLCLSREISGDPREECLDVWDMKTGDLLARFFTEGHLSNALVRENMITLGLASGQICSLMLENYN